MSSDVQITISAHPNAQDTPHIIFGFSSDAFSQCVYLPVPEDPREALQVADMLYKAYLDAAGEAVKRVRALKGTFGKHDASDS